MNSNRSKPRDIADGEKGFSLVELLVVLVLIGLLIGTASLMYYRAARSTDVKAAAEILKDDIRKVYAMTDSGVTPSAPSADGLKHRDQYRMEFHLAADDPPNCYRVLMRTWSGSSYGLWTLKAPDKQSSNKVIDGVWRQPSTSSGTAIHSVSGALAANEITFISAGSIVQTDAIGDVQITLRDGSIDKNSVVTISKYGSVE